MSTLLALFGASNGIIDTITGVIGSFLYPLFSVIFIVIDGVQAIFYAFAGIGNITLGSEQITSGNSGAENETGIVYYLLNNSLVKNMFMSILLLAFFLVIVFTVMAFIKNAYAAKPKGWKDIVGSAIKGLGSFIFLPVCVLLGVWFGNILLNAINGATSSGGSTTMARKLFIASSYNANIYRNGDGGDADDACFKITIFLEAAGLSDQFTVQEGQSMEYYANLVDEIYSTDAVYLGNSDMVGNFYNLYQINYLVLVVGGVFMLYVLGSLSAAMVKRLFFILILFIISPAVCALYPLDDGKAVGSWAGEVKKQVLSAYGAVAGLNLFYSLLPLIDKIQFGGFGFAEWMLSDFIQLFVMVIGLLTVKDLISLITGFVGGDDAYSKGNNLLSTAKNKILSGHKKASKVAGVAAPFVGGAAKSLWNVGKGAYKSTIGKGIDAIGDSIEKHKRDKAEAARRQQQQEKYGNLSRQERQTKIKELSERQARRNAAGESFASRLASDEYESYAMKHGVDTRTEEDLAAAKEAEKSLKRERSVLRKTGRAIKNSEFGKAVGEEAKKIPGGFKKLIAAIDEESGLKKTRDEITGEYLGALDRQAKRDGVEAGGRLGEKKVLKSLEALAEKGGGHINSMSTSVLNAMGEAFGEAVAKRFFNGKLGEEIKEARDELGLDKTSTRSDLASVDTVLQRLQHFADRISNSTGEAREQYIQGAIEYARDTDAGGNERLQEALNEAFTTFSDEGIKISGDVKFDEDGIVSGMTKASKTAGKAMADEMKKSLSSLMADVDKENRKKK